MDGEGRAGGAADQDPGAAAAGLGLLHPQEPGHDAGLRRGRAVQGVRVRPGVRGTLQSQESSQPQVGILQFTKPFTKFAQFNVLGSWISNPAVSEPTVKLTNFTRQSTSQNRLFNNG